MDARIDGQGIAGGDRALSTSWFIVTIALMCVGVVAVASAGVSLEPSALGREPKPSPVFRQAFFSLSGFMALLLVAGVGRRLLGSEAWVQRLALGGLAVAAVGLAATMIPGLQLVQRSSERWVRISGGAVPLGIQPSEFAKVAVVFFLAAWMARSGSKVRDLKKGFLPLAIALGLIVALVGRSNFGTAAVLAGTGGLMLLGGGCRLRHLAVFVLIGGMGMSALLIARPYRLERFTAFMRMWEDPRGAGYQPMQSLVSIASGGWTGVGLGSGIQKHGFLPEARTDFIFSLICEETGMVGGGLVIFLFVALAWLGLKTMRAARTPFERLLSFGLVVLIVLQAALNVAVVTVMVPPTGVPLPFISAGGSATLAMCVAMGLLLAVAWRAGLSAPPAGASGWMASHNRASFVASAYPPDSPPQSSDPW